MTSKRCYLICSTVPLFNKQGTVAVSHYTGTTKKKAVERLADHLACGLHHKPHPPGESCSFSAAHIASAFVRAGGLLKITRVWAGSRAVEKAIKGYGKLHQLCPACNPRGMKHKPKGLSKGKKVNYFIDIYAKKTQY